MTLRYRLGIGVFLLVCSYMTSCQTAKSVSYDKDENGVYIAHKSSIPKGAVRLTVTLLSDLSQQDDVYVAEAEVLRVNSYGGSFASQKPRKGQKVKLTIPGSSEAMRLKKGDKVILDALTPLQQVGELMEVSML
jgi:hypothetical protein